MSISNEQSEQAMQAVNLQIPTLDRALNAGIALAEAEVVCLRLLRIRHRGFSQDLSRRSQRYGSLTPMDGACASLGTDAIR